MKKLLLSASFLSGALGLVACDAQKVGILYLDSGVASDGGEICGRFCAPDESNLCVAGFWDCSSGTPTCSAVLNVASGVSCGGSSTCDGLGHCVEAGDAGVLPDAGSGDAGLPSACGRICFPEGNPCVAGAVACDSAGTETCSPIFSIAAGTACGTDLVCDGFGACVAIGSVVVSPTEGAEVAENAAAPFVFTATLSSTPEAPITLTVASGDTSICTVDPDTSSFELSARDVSRPISVRVSPVGDDEITGPRFCTLTFTSSEGVLTRTLRVNNTDVLWLTRPQEDRTANDWGHDSVYSVSPDGRYVVFATGLALVEEDDNDTGDVYAYDLVEKRFSLISVAADGTPGNNESYSPTVGFDGWIGFFSSATNLTTIPTSDFRYNLYFVKLGDRSTIRRAPFPDLATYSGHRSNYWFNYVRIATDAEVAFADITVQHPSGQYRAAAIAANLTDAGERAPFEDFFIASHEQGDLNDSADSDSHSVAGISPDGRYLAFVSRNQYSNAASNYTRDQLQADRIFGDSGDSSASLLNIRDRETDELVSVELGYGGDNFYPESSWDVLLGSLGNDGTAYFASGASYVDADTNGYADLYVLRGPFDAEAEIALGLEGVAGFASPLASSWDIRGVRTGHGSRYLGFMTMDRTLAGVTTLAPSEPTFAVAVDFETGRRVRVGRNVSDRDIWAETPLVLPGGDKILVFTSEALHPADTNRDGDLYIVPGF